MVYTTGFSGSQTSQNYTPAFLRPSSQMADCGTCQPPDHVSQSPQNNFFFYLSLYTSERSRKPQLTHSENIFSGCCLPIEDILIPRAWLGTLLICPKQANLLNPSACPDLDEHVTLLMALPVSSSPFPSLPIRVAGLLRV